MNKKVLVTNDDFALLLFNIKIKGWSALKSFGFCRLISIDVTSKDTTVKKYEHFTETYKTQFYKYIYLWRVITIALILLSFISTQKQGSPGFIIIYYKYKWMVHYKLFRWFWKKCRCATHIYCKRIKITFKNWKIIQNVQISFKAKKTNTNINVLLQTNISYNKRLVCIKLCWFGGSIINKLDVYRRASTTIKYH